MTIARRWKKQIRKARNSIAIRFFATRYGRELLVRCISPRVLTMTADCGDHRMTFSPHDYIGRKIYRKGHFERPHVERLLRVLKQRGLSPDGKVLLEIGANIGTQSLYFALDSDVSRIVGVEPDPRNFALYEKNIAENGLSDRIVAVNCAAGESEGRIDFYMNRDNHGKSSAMRQSPKDERIDVPVRPVTAILEDAGVRAEDVGLIWMDIEGYEPVAARSMAPLLDRRTPFYLEFSPIFYGPEDARAFAAFLAARYEHCIVFFEDRLQEMNVSDIPVSLPQFDLLLLP